LSYLKDFHAQWSFVLLSSLIFWCVGWVKPRFGLTAASLLIYAGISALWVWVWKDNRYLPLNVYEQMALRYFAADSLAKILLIVPPLMLLSENKMAMMLFGELIGSLFVCVNSLWIIHSLFKGCFSGVNLCGGMIGNPSISAGLMVCILPIFIRSWRKQWFVMTLATISVVASQSSVAMGLFAVYCGLWMWKTAKLPLNWKIFIPATATAGLLGLGRIAFGKELLNDSDRFLIWKYMMNAWATPWNIPTGTGLGTYHVFSINLQHGWGRDIAGSSWWNTLHNEPLQFLFECGIVGAVLFLSVYAISLYRAFREEFTLGLSVILFGLYMVLDPALHNPLPALFGAWLFVYALRQTNTFEEKP
jgi:hypothetical protein